MGIAVHEDIYNKTCPILFSVKQYNGSMLEVYDAAPLIDAGKNLFGTEERRHFPLLPGAHVICANKSVTAYRPPEKRDLKDGEGYGVWSCIAISVSADRDNSSDLFIEDAGIWTKNDNEEDLKQFLDDLRKSIVWSITECGIPKILEDACRRQVNAANTQASSKASGIRHHQVSLEVYPKELKLRVGGKRMNTLSIDAVCDWGE